VDLHHLLFAGFYRRTKNLDSCIRAITEPLLSAGVMDVGA
jgi:hypothetical protein